MAHTRPGVFKGQVRGVSHQGQEKTLHLKAGYIDADFPSFETFPLHSHGGPYIRQGIRPICCPNATSSREIPAQSPPLLARIRTTSCPKGFPVHACACAVSSCRACFRG